MFALQVIDPSLPPLAVDCPVASHHQADSLLGARILAENIAKERGLTITEWRPFGSDGHNGFAGPRPVALILKGTRGQQVARPANP